MCMQSTHSTQPWLKSIFATAPRIKGEAPEYRLPQQTDQRMATVLAGAYISEQEPLCYCRLVRPVDRPCARSPPAERHCDRYGLEREPDPWRAGDERLERALRLHLLSSAVRVQPVR